MRVEDLDLESLSEEDKAILFWRLSNENNAIRRWTEAQDVMALLGVLACPKGHSREISFFWADGQTAWFTKEGEKLPIPDRFESEGFDISQHGFQCCYCYDDECKDDPQFFVPEVVVNNLILDDG